MTENLLTGISKIKSNNDHLFLQIVIEMIGGMIEGTTTEMTDEKRNTRKNQRRKNTEGLVHVL